MPLTKQNPAVYGGSIKRLEQLLGFQMRDRFYGHSKRSKPISARSGCRKRTRKPAGKQQLASL